ncbi:MAG: acyl-CoA dehydrogenase family protein [Spirochaetales bacterium]|nr:acyl-CoA dehydrogenase family protein [Spirochaetales bacterium]
MLNHDVYFSQKHNEYRLRCSEFVNQNIIPHINEWEENNDYPVEIMRLAGANNLLGACFPSQYGGQDGDIFMSIVFTEEFLRPCSGGLYTSMVSLEYSLPLILELGTEEQQNQIIKSVIKGEKIIALAITEPDAGTDFSNLKTTAVKDGDFYLLNGKKMFITSGVKADFYIVAARTRDVGAHGLSLFIVEKGTTGFSVMRNIKKMGWWAGDTAELSFNNCKVPCQNLLGKENRAFLSIMKNFQKERLLLAVMANQIAQLALNECINYAKNRKIANDPLWKLQIIRHKLSIMATQIEISKEYNYRVANQMITDNKLEKEIAMAKNFATQTSDSVTYDAVQIFGGKGYIRDFVIERLYRDSRVISIGGGTTEIMNEIIADRLAK